MPCFFTGCNRKRIGCEKEVVLGPRRTNFVGFRKANDRVSHFDKKYMPISVRVIRMNSKEMVFFFGNWKTVHRCYPNCVLGSSQRNRLICDCI
jgi:hypothetical protein